MFGIVFEQTFILFVLIMLGAALAKFKILNDGATKAITDVVLYVVTPSVIIKSFIREKSAETLGLLVSGFIAALIIFAVYIIAATFIFGRTEPDKRAVLRFGMVFPNCGFMALPLLQATVGADGVLVGAAFVAAFNIYTWTYGVYIMSGDGKNMSVAKVLFNPGIVGLVIGFAVFYFSIPLPGAVLEPVLYMADLNTPLPMLVIGYNIYKTNLLKVLGDWRCLVATAVRLVVFPVATVLALGLFGIEGPLLTSIVICCSAPTAATTTMFAVKFDKSAETSVSLVAISTLISLVTIPLMVAILG